MEKKQADAKVKKGPKGNIIFSIGKRKKAVARASMKPGKGSVKINSIPLDNFKNGLFKMRIYEPLMLVGNDWKSYDFSINVQGGGTMGQADAARQSIARCIVQALGESTKAKYLEYDRSLLAYDPRRTEPHKSPRSSQGPRRYKQRSKR